MGSNPIPSATESSPAGTSLVGGGSLAATDDRSSGLKAGRSTPS